MSFGFSVGDFVAALQLVGTVIDAIRDSGGSRTEYRELINELYGLETALLRVKQLEFEEDQRSEYIALRQAAAQCQTTIDAFCARIKKYQKSLRAEGSGSTLTDTVAKLQWKLCRKDDLIKFKTDISAHTQSIQILLAALQVSKIQNLSSKVTTEYQSLGSAIQSGVSLIIGKLREQINSGLQNGIQILENTTKMMHTNIQIFWMVCLIQDTLSRVPKQIDREQPVIMTDALGRTAPFFLEFIRSADALKAVLRANFEKIPSGLRKIESGEFVIQDTATKRVIDFTRDWDICFLPGQKVHMSMIFRWQKRRADVCPICTARVQNKRWIDLVCPKCGVTFERIIEVENPPNETSASPRKTTVKHYNLVLQQLESERDLQDSHIPLVARPPRSAYDEEEDIRYYRQIKVVQRRRRKVREVQPAENKIDKERSSVTIADGGVIGGEDSSSLETSDIAQTTAARADHHEEDHDVTVSGESQTNDTNQLDSAVIDHDVFEQILEMDDDDEEREFSRAIIMDMLETNVRLVAELEKYVGCADVEGAQYRLYSWKGAVATVGFRKLLYLVDEMHDLAHNMVRAGDTGANAQECLWEHLEAVKVETDVVARVMRAFYRIDE